MKKEELREAIKQLDPENKVAGSSSATHADLTKELKAVKDATTIKSLAAAEVPSVPATLVVWSLNETHRVWKLVTEGVQVGTAVACLADALPKIDDIMPIDGQVYKIVDRSNDFVITAGDLDAANSVDPDRIYVSQNGNDVSFLRVTGGLVHLWSFGKTMEIAVGPNMIMQATDRRAPPRAKSAMKNTQKVFASWIISKNPGITPKELTSVMKEAFPEAKIVEDGRHGSHYLSLSRNGKLPIPPDEDPRTWGK